MRYIWPIFMLLLATLFLTYWPGRPSAPCPLVSPVRVVASVLTAPTPRADSLVRFALAQRGTAYCYAGTSPATGFDCSGFVRYVFGRFGLDVPHSTALLIAVGRPVARAQARPGDIVVFTGTAPGSLVPGHAGIVVSALGELPLRFVHASSAKKESGVKVSEVEGTGYEARFLEVRRVL